MNESDPHSNVHYLGSSENTLLWGTLSFMSLSAVQIYIAEVMGSNPVQAWIFFRPYFHYCLSSAHYCEDHFHSWFKCCNRWSHQKVKN